MACLLVGSGSSLVANAATNYWPSLSNWTLGSDNISLISGGTAFDLAGSNPSNKGVAMGSVSLPAGKSYRLTGKFSFVRRGTTASAIFSFLPANGDEIIIWQGAVGVTDINIDKVINLRSDQVGGAFFVYIETGGVVTLKDFTLIDDSTETGILNSIKEGFQKLWEWLKGIWDSIKEIPTKIAASLTALGDRIKTFFTDLVNNMRNFFTSLGDRISGFFNDIWEKIKSFFLPHDGYFDEYSAKFNAFIDEHFGFLAQLPDELSLIINTLVNYTPADPPYIDFPTVKVPIPGHEFTLIQGQKYVFTILTQSPYNMLYSAYQGFVWLAYCLMLFNFLKHKYNVIFGGDGSAD